MANVLEQGKRGLGEHGVLSQVPGSEVGERGYRGEHFIVFEVL